MRNKQRNIIIGLSIVLVFLVGFIGVNYYSDYQVKKMGEQFNRGFNEAINQMSVAILSRIQTDGYVQISYGNQSIVLVPYQDDLK